jgi:hypothetical protein
MLLLFEVDYRRFSSHGPNARPPARP